MRCCRNTAPNVITLIDDLVLGPGLMEREQQLLLINLLSS